VPRTLPVRQVYAWVVNEAGHVLLIGMPGGWNLPGGTPEARDGGWEATLRREVLEEADVTLGDVVPLGYQEVRAGDAAPFAQVRVAARVDEWRDQTPDPDSGLIYPRVWVPLGRAADLLGWGEPGHARAAAAAEAARDVYGFAGVCGDRPGRQRGQHAADAGGVVTGDCQRPLAAVAAWPVLDS
jgi:8-oxo-dGTP pyrophosphatase MutT (NUDIX family)